MAFSLPSFVHKEKLSFRALGVGWQQIVLLAVSLVET
jgi:hypothetical protein